MNCGSGEEDPLPLISRGSTLSSEVDAANGQAVAVMFRTVLKQLVQSKCGGKCLSCSAGRGTTGLTAIAQQIKVVRAA